MSTSWRVVSSSLLMLIAGAAVAATEHNVPERALPDGLILQMFGLGIGTIAITWVLIPAIFAWRNQLDVLIDLLKEGAIMRFVTVTYIVIVAVTLAIIDRMDGDKVSTLLASIAGYVLGQAVSARKASPEREDREGGKKRMSSLVTPDPQPRPSQAITASE